MRSSPSTIDRFRLFAVAATLACSIPAAAQQAARPGASPPSPAVAALRECSRLAAANDMQGAARVGKQAEGLFKTALSRNAKDADMMVGLARVQSQCILPSQELAAQGELSASAIELLQNALEIDSQHWLARFMLANIYLRSPSFLGRMPLAAKEFDELLRQQGDRTDNELYARVFELRGLMLSRARQADSARALWMRGSKLFPADSALRALLERAAPVPPPMETVATGKSDSVSGVVTTVSDSLGKAQSVEPPRATATLAAVQVVASSSTPPASATSVQVVSRATVLMTAGGTADVMQAVQAQAGATRVSEGSDIHTRGGATGETALIVDGARMQSLSRFEGLNGSMFGALDPFVVKSMRYSTGGFSAKFGNALSGVLEIETDGRPRERNLRGGVSMAQASLSARLPYGKKIGTWATARASNAGVILATHGRTNEFEHAPHSEELIASIIANPSATNELRATVIGEQDDSRRFVNAAGWNGPFHSAGAARTAMVSSRWMPGSAPVIVRSNVSANSRSTDWNFGVLARTRDEGSVGARSDVEWSVREAITMRAGIEHTQFSRRERGVLPTSANIGIGSPVRTLASSAEQTMHSGGYIETQVAVRASMITLGLRSDRLPGETAVTFDPRIAISTRRGDWTARIAGGLFHQGRWQLASAIPDAGTPGGMPRLSRQVVAGVEREGNTTLRVEAFNKQYGEYANLGAGPQISSSSARGVDVSAQGALGSRTTGWANYSLLNARARLADGRTVRSPYDITHSATLSATTALSGNWSLGTTARYGTGAPFTPVVGASETPDHRYLPVYGATSSERMPTYARLDARLMRFMRTPGYLVTSFVEVLNVTDRANVASLSYDAAYKNRQDMPTFFASRTFVIGAEIQRR